MANSVFTGYISNGVNLAVTSYTSGQNPLSVGQVLYTNGISVGAGSNMSRIATSAGDGVNYTLSNPDSFPSYYTTFSGNTTVSDGIVSLNSYILPSSSSLASATTGWCIEFWLKINNVAALPTTYSAVTALINVENRRNTSLAWIGLWTGGMALQSSGYPGVGGTIQKTWASNTWYHIGIFTSLNSSYTMVTVDGKAMTAFTLAEPGTATPQNTNNNGFINLLQHTSTSGYFQVDSLGLASSSAYQIFDFRVHNNPSSLPYNYPSLPLLSRIQGCVVANTAGGFTFDNTQNSGTGTPSTIPLNVGMGVYLSGAFSGPATPGGITGYTGSGMYYIIATNGTSNFQLSATPGGAAVTSTATVGGTLTNPIFYITGQQIFTKPSSFLATPEKGQLYFSAAQANVSAFNTTNNSIAGPSFNWPAASLPYKSKVNNAISGTLPFTPNTYSLTVNAIDVANSGTQNTVMNIPTRSRTILDKYTPLPKSIAVYPLNRRSFAIPNRLSSNAYNLMVTESASTTLIPYILNKNYILTLSTSKFSYLVLNFSYGQQQTSSRNTILNPAITRADKTVYATVKKSFAKSSLSSNAYNLMVTESFSTTLVPYVLNKNYILTLSTSKIGNNTVNFSSSNTYNLQYVRSRNTIFRPVVEPSDETVYPNNNKAFARGRLSSNTFNYSSFASRNTTYLVFYPIMTRGLTGDKNISTGTSASQIWTTG